MTYNTTLKKRSQMKRIMNIFLTQCTTADSNAIVIDANTLMSSKTLKKHGLTPDNIIVLNDDKEVIKRAYKQGHTYSKVGISTSVLPYLPGLFDLIYLDYCGTPAANKHGYWNPHMDILWSADRLTENGVVIATFTTGHIDNAIQRANLMIPNSLTLVKELSYCETTPMYVMILSKSKDVKRLRDTFNMIYTRVKQRGSNLDKQMTTGKKRKATPAHVTGGKKRKAEEPGRVKGVSWNKVSKAWQVRVKNKTLGRYKKREDANLLRKFASKKITVIWGKDNRKDYKQYVGHEFEGTVLKKGKEGWIIEWKDKEDGSTDIPLEWIKELRD